MRANAMTVRWAESTGDARWRSLGARLGDSGFVLPALVLSIVVFFYPTVDALWHGFTDWQPGLQSNFTGLTNFRRLFADDTFHQVLGNSGIYLLAVPVLVIVPLFVAFMLYEGVPGARLFRTIFLFPLVLSPPILGLLFSRSSTRPTGCLTRPYDASGSADSRRRGSMIRRG